MDKLLYADQLLVVALSSMNQNLVRFIEVVLVGALFGGLNAIASNIGGAGLVSTGVALAITAFIGVIEKSFSPAGTALFGSITVN